MKVKTPFPLFGWELLPEKNLNNVPDQQRHDASTTSSVRLWLVQYMLINT